MNSFWDVDVPFIPLFGVDHLLYIAIMAVCLAALLTSRHWVRRNREWFRWVLFGVSAAQFTVLYAWYLLETGFDLAEALPLHISRASTILGMAFLATRSRRVMDVAFYLGLFAYLTFLMPQRIYPITHVIGWSFLISHIMTILLPVFAAIAYGWRPTVPALWRSFAWFLGYFALVLVVNPLVGGNYFYLRERPLLKGLPSPAYEALAVAVTLLLFWIGYLVARAIVRAADSRHPAAADSARPAGAAH
ncbi:MAG: TIGR02206 family membrane protein [bacterium]|nr:TIGR02206 family membrane protein [bacterium]